MTTLREALQFSLGALEYAGEITEPEGDLGCNCLICQATILAKEALAQPEPWEKFCDSYCVWTDHHPDCKLAEQKPVGLIESLKDAKPCCGEYETCWRACTPRGKFLGQRDAQRTWVGLTDEEREEIALEVPMDAVLITEAKLKEKNT